MITQQNISKKVRSIKTKDEARAFAIEFQDQMSNARISWGEVAFYQNHLNKLARRFGLVKEFRENGII